MAEFAAGLRLWSKWPSWFNPRAGQLVRLIDRSRFEQLKAHPEAGVAALLREEGVTIRPAEPLRSEFSETPLRPEEYGVFSAVCRQFDLFRFNQPDTVFENQTAGDVVEHPATRRRLEYDEQRREYKVIQPGLVERFVDPFRKWFDRYPEMLAQHEWRNRCHWPLEKCFEVENGYRFMSELGVHERDKAQGAFALSRVGFSANGQFALVFIRYAVTCSYYLVFEGVGNSWQRADFRMAWVT
jgi:hypothetical protein